MDLRSIARRDREWFGDILCGNCRKKIAGRARHRVDGPNGEDRYFLYFEAAMLPDPGRVPGEDGIWKLTAHGRERLAKGKRPAVRRQKRRAFGYGKDERRNLGTMFSVGIEPRGRPLDAEQVPPELPARVECPYCRSVQFLDPEVLDVDNSGM